MRARVIMQGRINSPSSGAGTFTDIPLAASERHAEDEQVQYMVNVLASSGSGALLKAYLEHGMDEAFLTHTATLIASTALGTVPTALAGDMSSSTMQADVLRPVLQMGTNDGNAQWADVEVWQLTKRFPDGRGLNRHRKVGGPITLHSGSTGAGPGYALPACDEGDQVRVVQYMVTVLDASAGTAALGLDIEHSSDGKQFATQRSIAPAAVGSTIPRVMVFDCDTTKVVGQHFRAVLTTSGTGGDRLLVEVYETVKALYP